MLPYHFNSTKLFDLIMVQTESIDDVVLVVMDPLGSRLPTDSGYITLNRSDHLHLAIAEASVKVWWQAQSFTEPGGDQ